MLFRNARLYAADGQFRLGSFRVENGVFTEVLYGEADNGEDLRGALVLPGLIDLHTHGNCGDDFSDGDPAGLTRMARYLAAHGVTTFAPTSMTLPYDVLEVAFSAARCLKDNLPADCADVAGIHMEGPFLSDGKKGAQNGDYLQAPDVFAFRRLYQQCGELIRLVDVAPELTGAERFARELSPFCTVSAAHAVCNYEQAAAFFEAGGHHVTHLFNAMPPLHHREPGLIAAAAERENVTAELICDGYHIHPAAVRMAFRLFPGRICLISDALRCCGMADGDYELGGQTVRLSGGVARLPDGTIAGSAANLFDCLRRAVSFGIPLEQAVAAATSVPAGVLGMADQIGAIAPGYRADFLLCSEDLTLKKVFLRGNPL